MYTVSGGLDCLSISLQNLSMSDYTFISELIFNSTYDIRKSANTNNNHAYWEDNEKIDRIARHRFRCSNCKNDSDDIKDVCPECKSVMDL